MRKERLLENFTSWIIHVDTSLCFTEPFFFCFLFFVFFFCFFFVVVVVFLSITKTCLYNFDPLKPHFYIVKLEFTGVYIIFLISAKKHRLWVLVRTASPRRDYLQPMFWAEIWKISEFFIWKFSVFGGEFFYIFDAYNARICPLCHKPVAKDCFTADWSEPSLSAYRNNRCCKLYRRTE